MQDCPEAKKPCKGILKTSSSFDRPGASYRKSAKFDELNVLQTYHPLDKDYGHMKIEEPKTPFNFTNAESVEQGLDANLLAEKLRIAADCQTPSFGDDDNFSDEEFPETEEEKVRRLEFERRRKAHYNEFEAVRLARKLIEEELLDDDDDDDVDGNDEASAVSISNEEIQSKTTDSEYKRQEEEGNEEENTIPGTETNSTAPSVISTNVRPMDVDNEEASNPCAGREH